MVGPPQRIHRPGELGLTSDRSLRDRARPSVTIGIVGIFSQQDCDIPRSLGPPLWGGDVDLLCHNKECRGCLGRADGAEERRGGFPLHRQF